MRVCILGAGLSSLTLAKALVNENIHVDLLASKKKIVLDESRTIGISKSNIEFFNKHIINVGKIIWKLKKIEIYSENFKDQKLIEFKNNSHELFSIVKNFKLYRCLEESLNKDFLFKKISLKKKINFIEKYDLVINTDFFNPITRKYFSKNIVKKYNSFAYTTIIKHQNIKNNVAFQIFTKKGPLAFLPISTSETSIVYSLDGNTKIKNKNINDLIFKFNKKYKIKKIDEFKSFELKSLNLRSYYYKNLLAFGDLLHRIHPLAGQGFNMTIRDIKILLEIIKTKRDMGLPIDSSVNSEFEKILKHKNYLFSSGIDLINEFFNLERKTNSLILSKSVKLIGKNTLINKLFTKIADEGVTI